MIDERYKTVWVFVSRLRRGVGSGTGDYRTYLQYLSKSAEDPKVRRYAALQLAEVDRMKTSA